MIPQANPRASGFGLLALVLALLVPVTLLAIWFGLTLGGGAEAQTLADPGAVVRWGLPVLKGLLNLSMATAIGALALACYASAEGSAGFVRLRNLATAAASVWAVTGIGVLVFTYLSVTGQGISASDSFGAGLWLFATDISLGQAISWNLAIAALVAVLSAVVQRLTRAIFVAALAIGGLVPLALSGHAAGTTGHGMAVNALGLHLAGISLWVGGLVALLVAAPVLGDQIDKWLARYSQLALVAFLLVATSGVAAATLRLNNLNELFTTGYGQLVALKSLTLLLLGAAGAWLRLRVVGAARALPKLLLVELALMALATGLATALARTEPPKLSDLPASPTPAQILTGELLPAPLTPERWFTAGKLDLIWASVVVLAVGFYLVGVIKLHRRGDKWPVIRTVSWLGGMAMLAYITNGAINVYEPYLFSVHMIGHMMLTMGVATLLVPGAPVTLLLRTIAKRHDASMGLREWVLWAVHTPWARFVSHPIVAAINFASSLVVFYFTDLFAFATREHVGHEWMVLHFLMTGYLFVQSLIGVDPGPKTVAYPIRLMILIGTLAFHAFFGLALMQDGGLILADWFGAMGRTWGETPMADQKTGGAIAWGIGELPAAVITLIVSIQWAKADGRETKRLDRASDRRGNQDLEEYNKMLARLAERHK